MSKMPMPFSDPGPDYKGHLGVDFGQREGTPIPSIAAGTITYRDQWGTWGWYNGVYQRGGGWTVTVTRDDGLKILSCHMPNLDRVPRLGTRVKVGDIVGAVGNSGKSTGPHLHTQFFLSGQDVNEWDYMDRNNWIGKSVPAGGGGSTPLPGKDGTVTLYHREDATARSTDKKRIVKPGAGFYLNTKIGQPASQASGIAGKPGDYVFAGHVYAQGRPGDAVEVRLVWDDRVGSKRNSGHYIHRAVFDDDGYIRENFPFIRGVATGYAVYAYLSAVSTNREPFEVTIFDTDAFRQA